MRWVQRFRTLSFDGRILGNYKEIASSISNSYCATYPKRGAVFGTTKSLIEGGELNGGGGGLGRHTGDPSDSGIQGWRFQDLVGE